MNLILNIDTAVHTASICISDGDRILGKSSNPNRKDSASWLHTAISDLVKDLGLELNQFAAVAVSAGPGSYTGLRVGMAAAKGICYSLKKPLITINTLKQMALAAKDVASETWLCPMIDARRMEVFTAVYKRENLEERSAVSNIILDKESFADLLNEGSVCFFGDGSNKFKSLVQHKHAVFREIEAQAEDMAPLSSVLFKSKSFADLAYTEPTYGKDFYSVVKVSL